MTPTAYKTPHGYFLFSPQLQQRYGHPEHRHLCGASLLEYGRSKQGREAPPEFSFTSKLKVSFSAVRYKA